MITIPYSHLYAVRRYRIFIWKTIRDKKPPSDNAFDYWQNNLFLFIITWIMPIGILVTILVSCFELKKGDYTIVLTNIFTIFSLNTIVLQRSLSVFIRKLLFAIILAIMSLTMAGFLHNLSLGGIYLFTASIFMALFFSGSIAYAGVVLNAMVLAVFTFYLQYSPTATADFNISLYNWVIFAANFLFIDMALVLLIRVLLTSIERSLKTQKELNRQLIREARLKHEQHRRLREIAFIQSHLVRAPLLNIKGISHLIINTQEYNIEEALLLSLEKSVEELDGVIKSVVERTAV
ncbi:hypothetical protein SAMN05421788_11662 [Filimonas lacunae]|uniref:MASE11 domain-containing protein n=1 Tax=Filimonas lacunae TaxID=477680 RepID=A0A173MGK3_9BACT|nr:hypothetical protein [Filimonas lacunae]BAV06733.1 hypothetical protein FLA_2753 [Filimonas lacunae]SIT34448.1 hypothetical protein SAMN05421788_11662 [Filimonas lacunae]